MSEEKYPEWIREYAREVAKLSIEFARRTGYFPVPTPLGVILLPLKWVPNLEKAIKKGVVDE